MNNESSDQPPPAPTPPAVPPVPAPPPPIVTGPYPIERKSAFLAVILSVIPGLSHLYVGAYKRALQVFGGLILSIVLTAVTHGHTWPLIVFTWFYGLVDSVRLTSVVNRGVGYQRDTILEEPLKSNGAGGLTLGVILVGLGLLWWADSTFNIDWSFMETWGGPAAFILLGLVLIITHLKRKRAENESGVGMPPRST
jgi:hypothetical protein